MSPTCVPLSLAAPPTPSVSQDTTGPGGSDPSNQPARSFRQVLDDQSASNASQQTSSAAPPVAKPGSAQNSNETTDTTDTDAAEESGDSVPDDHSTESAEQAANAVGDTSAATTGKASAVATKKQSPKAANGAGSTAHATDHDTGDDSTQALPADEQPATPTDEKQGGGGKQKNAKAAPESTVPDATAAAAIAAATARDGPTASTPASRLSVNKTDSPEVSQASDKPRAASGSAQKSPAKSDLHAEEPGQSTKQSGATAQKTKAAANGNSDGSDATTSAQTASADATASSDAIAKTADHPAVKGDFAAVSQQIADAGASQKTTDAPKAPVAQPAIVPAPTAADFAAANHAQIVDSVHTQLLPNGGTMRLRLDPPDLGAMQVTVRMRDGVMSAEFQTSNDQAAKLLSHSLGDLKTQLESQGMSVDKLHVTSAPQESRGKGGESESGQQRGQSPTDEQRREQQRKEMLRRMWSKLAKGDAPLDMVA
jgi:flagellar hook-length control protein FliK